MTQPSTAFVMLAQRCRSRVTIRADLTYDSLDVADQALWFLQPVTAVPGNAGALPLYSTPGVRLRVSFENIAAD